MNNRKEYITKSELLTKWTNSIIEKHFPQCSMEKPNPYNRKGSTIKLYDAREVERIEKTQSFKDDMEKAMKRRIASLERADKKRNELITKANAIKINIPNYEKNKLIKDACNHYNDHNGYANYNIATPSSDETFLKRITINYLRHQCTSYDKELDNFFNNVGVQEAHDILKERINKAIKEKYEWLA